MHPSLADFELNKRQYVDENEKYHGHRGGGAQLELLERGLVDVHDNTARCIPRPPLGQDVDRIEYLQRSD